MSTKYFEPSPMPLKKVSKIQFGLLNPEEIRSSSVVTIEHTDNYDGAGNPKEGGLLDLRLGPIDGNYRCLTCGGTTRECPGHFGLIELAKPVFHEGFIGPVIQILRCICFQCSALRVDPKDPKMKQYMKIKNPAARLRKIADLSRT